MRVKANSRPARSDSSLKSAVAARFVLALLANRKSNDVNGDFFLAVKWAAAYNWRHRLSSF